MLEIGNSELCNGCHACYSVCPVSAIEMVADNEGFLRPYIDKNRCINCYKCEKSCPVLIKNTTFDNYDILTYACYNHDEKIRKESSSGGLFTLIAEYVIKNDGIVFGAKFDNNFNVIHGSIETLKGLEEFRGSKYVQSSIGDTFKECKRHLELKILVLFSGTPCQIAGLKHYLNNEYQNLICIDFICHGVPSPLLWKKYLDYQKNKYNSNIEIISFRNKQYGWKNFSMYIQFSKKYYLKKLKSDPYLQLFLHDVCLRPSCYNCSFKDIHRISDITIADFWGIHNIMPDIDDDKGISCVIIHSKKGEELFNKVVKNKFKVNINDIKKYNPAIIKSAQKPFNRDAFFNDLKYNNFKVIKRKYYYSYIYNTYKEKALKIFRIFWR